MFLFLVWCTVLWSGMECFDVVLNISFILAGRYCYAYLYRTTCTSLYHVTGKLETPPPPSPACLISLSSSATVPND